MFFKIYQVLLETRLYIVDMLGAKKDVGKVINLQTSHFRTPLFIWGDCI